MQDILLERFLKYLSYDTQSIESADCFPSSEGQKIFAEMLAKELIDLDLSEVKIDNNCYVTACLPSNSKKELPTFGLIAHIDTSPDLSGANVNPKIISNYNALDIVLNEEQNIILKVEENPELKDYIGQTIICTDGKTLLGADNKAGIAEIITAIEKIKKNNIEHGNIKIAFMPDEEIGKGTDFFNVENFNADFAYTIDGGKIGEIVFENFNAAIAHINFSGVNFHPGYAKNKMINAINVMLEFQEAIPKLEKPEHTEKLEGFYHIVKTEGTVENANLSMIIRDHDTTLFEQRKNKLIQISDSLNRKYESKVVNVEIIDQYYNMKSKIEPVFHIVEYAFQAMKNCNINIITEPLRGGTDGARLSYKGLPCPNIFTGGHNFHSKFEYIPLESMHKAVDFIINLNKVIVDNYK